MKQLPLGWLLVLGLAVLALAGGALGGVPAQLASVLWLGVFPGLCVASLLEPRSSRLTRWTLGLTLSPLVATVLGWALASLGLGLRIAAAAVALAGWLGVIAFERRERDPEAAPSTDAPASRFLLVWTTAAAIVVALPLALNPWIRIHWDGWVHAGLVWEIHERGIPPQDPRFAGLPLNYVWFYNLFVAMLLALHPGDPFVAMAIVNVVLIAATVLMAWALGWTLWRDRRAAAGTVALTTLGLNAGAWLLWPLGLIAALKGEVRGLSEVKRIVGRMSLGTDHVIYSLSAPFAHMVSFLDKYLLGTSVGYAYLLLLLALWSMLVWLRDGRRTTLVLGGLAAAGMLLFHVVVGLSVVPVTIGAVLLAAPATRFWPWLPPPRRLVAFGAATIAGMLVAGPYLYSILHGWTQEESGFRVHYLRPGWQMPWTLLTSCGAAAAFALGPLRASWKERRPEAAVLALWLLAMTGFALVVHLAGNNEAKFAFQVLVPLAAFGGAGFLPTLERWRRHRGPVVAALAVVVLFVVPPAMTLLGDLVDPTGRTAPALNPVAGETRLYAWIRGETPRDAVFVDAKDRDLVMVLARRRMLAGTPAGPELAAFPATRLAERRAVMADLYGGARQLGHDFQVLDRLGAPVFVLFRPQDSPHGERPWAALEAASPRFQLVYDADGFRVYRLESAS